MILKSARVTKYKSIDDSGVVRFEPDVTCLVGRNESGKTAFLEALARANPMARGADGFDELRDYPRRLRATERGRIAATVPVTASFELGDGDVEALWTRFGPGVVTSREVRLERTYGGARRLVVQLADGASRGAGASEAAGASGAHLGAELAAFLAERLPRFLYFGQYSVLPGRVSIPRLQTLDPGELSPGERTARALLRLAGVAAEDFVDATYEARRAALESAAARIGEEVFRYWSQGGELVVELDVDFRADPGRRLPGPFLEVRIRDERHRITMNVGERSEGFVWFFSFVAAFSEVRDADGVVVLLDEPGLGLHAAAQADLLRYLEEQLAPRHQVVYTTHSPFMIDPARLHRIRTVEDSGGDGGTKVRESLAAGHRDTLVPVRAALAGRLLERLEGGPDTLLVPEPADLVYLEVLGAHLREAGRGGLDPRWTLVPAGGPLPHEVAPLAAARSPLPAALAQVAGRADAGVEDLFDEGFYLELLGWSGLEAPRAGELPEDGGSLVKRVECALGRPLDRYRPARYLLLNQANLLPALGQPTIDRFARLFETINAHGRAARPP